MIPIKIFLEDPIVLYSIDLDLLLFCFVIYSVGMHFKSECNHRFSTYVTCVFPLSHQAGITIETQLEHP